jgi:hypothetical protein
MCYIFLLPNPVTNKIKPKKEADMERKMLVVVGNGSEYEMRRALISVESRSSGTLGHVEAKTLDDAKRCLETEISIVGVISTFKLDGANIITLLGAECRKRNLPLIVCLCQEDYDDKIEENRDQLEDNGIAYAVTKNELVDWEGAVGRILNQR